jgi:hypothetical protein
MRAEAARPFVLLAIVGGGAHPCPSPLYTSSAGKTLLAELPEIRTNRLAFNRGATLAHAFVVDPPLLTRDCRPIAAISAAVEASGADRLDAVGEELKKAVATLGPNGLHASRLRAPCRFAGSR